MTSRCRRRVQKRLFQCGVCGRKAPAAKGRGPRTAPGHVKHMYCIACRAVTAHVQLD